MEAKHSRWSRRARDGEYYKPFDVATLNKLYPTHAAYVSTVEAKVTNENLTAGFISSRTFVLMQETSATAWCGRSLNLRKTGR
jgi:hypothetical protein